MKKIILTLFGAALILSSCADAYEVEQPGNRSDETEVFKNTNEIERGILGLYSGFDVESEIEFVSYFTDELGVGISNAGKGVNDGTYSFAMTPSNDYARSIWGTSYNIVNRANRMLNRIDQLMVETPADLEALKRQKAIILGLRAYHHFKLFSYFTPDYKNPSGPSVIKFDFLHTDDYNRFEKRATVAEIVELIEDDIEKAKDLNIGSSDNTLMSNSVLDAILVKLYSMTENYAGLESAFNNLVNIPTPYGVGSASQYLATFSDDQGTASSNPDIIFRMSRKVNQRGSHSVASAWYSDEVSDQDAIISMEIGRSLYNEFDKLDPASFGLEKDAPRMDVRYAVNVSNYSKVATNYASLSQDNYMKNDVLLVGKYPGRTAAPLQNDVMVFRFTDMLLALAEKRAAEGNINGPHVTGDFSNVESIIYHIRANRSVTDEALSMPVITNSSSAYKAILNERRVEFAFEGTRYLDVRRLGQKAGVVGFERYSKDCASTNACQLEANSFKMILPIPSTEMISNNNMTQNPGY